MCKRHNWARPFANMLLFFGLPPHPPAKERRLLIRAGALFPQRQGTLWGPSHESPWLLEAGCRPSRYGSAHRDCACFALKAGLASSVSGGGGAHPPPPAFAIPTPFIVRARRTHKGWYPLAHFRKAVPPSPVQCAVLSPHTLLHFSYTHWCAFFSYLRERGDSQAPPPAPSPG